MIFCFRTKYWQELAGRPGLTRLKTLARDKLGVDIQSGEHNSVNNFFFVTSFFKNT